MVDVGDLILMKTCLTEVFDSDEKKSITGVVVGTTLDHPPNSQGDEPPDYWIRVVFLDGTKSTLFHDEVKIIAKNNGENSGRITRTLEGRLVNLYKKRTKHMEIHSGEPVRY